jgi:hypothetical protein
VRKEGSNKGRWFYTCQEPKDKGCGFFLWDEDAAGREMRAVISNSRSEPAAAAETRPTTSSNTRDKTTVEGHIEASNKWMADLIKDEEEEFGDWPLSAEDLNSLVRATEGGAILPAPHMDPETPRKAIKLDSLSTPGSKRKRDDAEAWPTPATGQMVSDDVFATPSTTRFKGGRWDGNERLGLISPSATPTPTRFRTGDLPVGGNNVASDAKDYDVTQEVMEALKDHSLDEDTSVKLRQILNRHALKSQGIVRGRDITRIALKSKDAKIAELQQRITALENEREMDKLVIKHFKDDMAHSISRRGRGRGKPLEG